MAPEHEWAVDPEPPRRRFGMTRWLLVIAGIWLAVEAVGTVVSVVRHLVALLVLAVLVVLGWRIGRARKS